MKRYADTLKESKSEDTVEYQLLGNDIPAVMETLLEHENYEDAKLVRVMAEAGVFTGPKGESDAKKSGNEAKVHALNASLENMSIENRKAIKEITHQEAEQHFACGEAVLAACYELAADSVESAVLKLIRANELFLAYYVARMLKVPLLDHIQFLLGMRSERLGQLEQAGFYYKNSRNPRTVELFAARNKLDYAKYMPQKDVNYAKLAAESKGPDSVFYHILAGNVSEACKLVIDRTKSMN